MGGKATKETKNYLSENPNGTTIDLLAEMCAS
jgi:hypothetical protein